MNLGRRLLLPVVVATPLWLWAYPVAVAVQGWDALLHPGIRVIDLVWGALMTLIGLLVVGLPAASLVSRIPLGTPARISLLIVSGVFGGGLIAILYLLCIADLSEGVDLTGLLQVAPFGFIPGGIVASVWTMINSDKLRQSAQGTSHGRHV